MSLYIYVACLYLKENSYYISFFKTTSEND